MLRYWFATRLGGLETARNENIAEIICPDCGMLTAIDRTKHCEQECYFCQSDLINKSTEQKIEPISPPQSKSSNMPNSSSENMQKAN